MQHVSVTRGDNFLYIITNSIGTQVSALTRYCNEYLDMQYFFYFQNPLTPQWFFQVSMLLWHVKRRLFERELHQCIVHWSPGRLTNKILTNSIFHLEWKKQRTELLTRVPTALECVGDYFFVRVIVCVCVCVSLTQFSLFTLHPNKHNFFCVSFCGTQC